MRTRQIALSTIALLAVLMTGCGKAVNPADSFVTEETLPAVPAGLVIHISKDKVRPTPSPAVGVLVDGRYYPKGQEPKVAATPSPAAPQAGKGHLHVSVTLANRSGSFVDHLDLSINTKDGDTPVFTRSFAKAELVGSKLSATATDLAPGDYTITLTTVAGTGNTLSKTGGEAKVEADKSVDASI